MTGTMVDVQKTKSILKGLGRPTNRGIKKCPKCGTWNGTRGVFCKNMMCLHLLKSVEDQSIKAVIRACKLITDDSTHIFSVRSDDKGLDDQRGFVQLPLNKLSKGLCFIDNCPETFNSEILKVHERARTTDITCGHIDAAKMCTVSASPIALNPMIIDSMDLLPNVKEGLWDLLSDNFSTAGPVVQRISKSVFVVKCRTSPKHPLGYLHLTIYNNVKHKDKADYRHYCACPLEYKDLNSPSEDLGEKKCVHYYAVICSFASDQKLATEFSHFMECEQMLTLFVNQYLSLEDTNDQLVAIFNVHPEILAAADNVSMSQELEGVELITTDPAQLKSLSADDNLVCTYLTIGNSSFDENIASTDIILKEEELIGTPIQQDTEPTTSALKNTKPNTASPTKPKADVKSTKRKAAAKKSPSQGKMVKVSDEQKVTNKSVETFQKRLARYVVQKPSPKSLEQMQLNAKVEENLSVDFLHWVAAISERIYQEMHYQFECTKPKTLTFFPTPMSFFKPLVNRLATLGPKRRLPNSTVAHISKTPPIGTYMKHTWDLNNIIHVKRVLDNPHFPLQLTRSFVRSGEDTYIPSPLESDPPKSDPPTPHSTSGRTLPPLRPLELVTYLKVGHTQPLQSEPTPFTLEFLSDVLPASQMGELKIRFEYGRLAPTHNR